tara:strand:- start:94 stop:282 length:189 start_codon:yes stop_codon:yes gene_type:complete
MEGFAARWRVDLAIVALIAMLVAGLAPIEAAQAATPECVAMFRTCRPNDSKTQDDVQVVNGE